MRAFGIIDNGFWKNESLQRLPVPTRYVAIYLASGPHTNAVGCFRLPLSYISEDLNIQSRFVMKAIKELEAISFLKFDTSSKYFAIMNFFTTRVKKSLANSNFRIAATRELEEIPDSVPFKKEIQLQLIEIIGEDLDGDSNAVGSASKRRSVEGDLEGDLKVEEKDEEKGEEDADASAAGGISPSPASSHLQTSPVPSLPKDFSFPLQFGRLEIPREQVDQWQQSFPHICVPAKLQKYLQYYEKHKDKRMYKQGMTTAIIKHLQEDNNDAT
jgi:hypothetical protein